MIDLTVIDSEVSFDGIQLCLFYDYLCIVLLNTNLDHNV